MRWLRIRLARSRIFLKSRTIVIYDDSDTVLVDMHRVKYKFYNLDDKIKMVDVGNNKEYEFSKDDVEKIKVLDEKLVGSHDVVDVFEKHGKDNLRAVKAKILYGRFRLMNAEKYIFTCLPIPALLATFVKWLNSIGIAEEGILVVKMHNDDNKDKYERLEIRAQCDVLEKHVFTYATHGTVVSESGLHLLLTLVAIEHYKLRGYTKFGLILPNKKVARFTKECLKVLGIRAWYADSYSPRDAEVVIIVPADRYSRGLNIDDREVIISFVQYKVMNSETLDSYCVTLNAPEFVNPFVSAEIFYDTGLTLLSISRIVDNYQALGRLKRNRSKKHIICVMDGRLLSLMWYTGLSTGLENNKEELENTLEYYKFIPAAIDYKGGILVSPSTFTREADDWYNRALFALVFKWYERARKDLISGAVAFIRALKIIKLAKQYGIRPYSEKGKEELDKLRKKHSAVVKGLKTSRKHRLAGSP